MAASRRGRLGTALIVVGGLALAGCSSGPPASKRPFAAYRQCLQQHGVKPRRHGAATSSTEAGAGATTSTTRPDPAAFAAARQACRGLRPAGGLRGGGINSGARASFRKCMADHGVTLPTFGSGGPGSSGGTGGRSTTSTENPLGPRGGMLRGLNRNDPNVAAALRACRSFLGTGSTTTTRK